MMGILGKYTEDGSAGKRKREGLNGGIWML